MAPETTRHPRDYPWRERFSMAARVVAREGGAVYAAEDLDDKSLWLITDERAAEDLQLGEAPRGHISLTRYPALRDRSRWAADIIELRGLHADRREAPVDVQRHAETEALLAALVDQTARDLASEATRRQLKRVNERDHLQPCCAAAARALATSWALRPTVSTQLEVAFHAWPRIGNVDIALSWPGRQTLLELKCGDGANATGECVWDAVKLAFALQCGKTNEAYLLAGAPASDWRRPIRGAELFSDAEHDIALLRVVYGDWWRHWEHHGDPQPTELPARFRTKPVHAAELEVGGVVWELRLAVVSVDDRERVRWPRLTAGADD